MSSDTTSTATAAAPLAQSEETVPVFDAKNDCVAYLKHRCERICKIAYECRQSSDALFQARKASPVDVDALVAAAMLHQRNEDDLIVLRNDVIAVADRYNRGREERERIYVAYTAQGLPIRVDSTRKTPIWG